jgi:hypothetical protein
MHAVIQEVRHGPPRRVGEGIAAKTRVADLLIERVDPEASDIAIDRGVRRASICEPRIEVVVDAASATLGSTAIGGLEEGRAAIRTVCGATGSLSAARTRWPGRRKGRGP